jgi:hypothetical protein
MKTLGISKALSSVYKVVRRPRPAACEPEAACGQAPLGALERAEKGARAGTRHQEDGVERE